MKLSALYEMFQSSVVNDRPADVKKHLVSKPDFPAEAQMLVYINAYRIRLGKAVEADFPALKNYLQEKIFRTLVYDFVRATPSRHFNLDKYASDFPAFLNSRTEDTFAQELAALEGAIRDVHAMPDSGALEASALAGQPKEARAAGQWKLRSAHRLLAFSYPTENYLARFRDGETPEKPAKSDQRIIVYRDHNTVRREILDRGEFALLSLLAAGKSLNAALEDASMDKALPRQEAITLLQSWFTRWLKSGMLAA